MPSPPTFAATPSTAPRQLARGLLSCLTVAAILCGSVRASDDQALDQTLFFEQHIRPVLIQHCYRCHSVEEQKIRGGLALDSPTAMLRGGDSGAAVVPGEPDESLLLSALEHDSFEMPPDRKLPAETIAHFRAWIADGAHDPRSEPAAAGDAESNDSATPAAESFWAFQPLSDTPPAAVSDRDWPRSRIDHYVLNQLEQHKLRPAPPATRATLLRRAHFALTGLPPTPDELRRFEHDSDPDAWRRAVDRLLASPDFGVRWGRHWLDVVRFAESSGGGRTLLFPQAWRYRDYVIDAWNSDLPYGQFVAEQIAGDLLPANDWRQRRRQWVATAFLLLGPTNYELQDKDILEMDIVDEQLDTMGKAFLGLTLGCARCHDHKFDPISTKEYYALAGIFKNTRSVIHDNVSKWNMRRLPEPAAIQEAQQQYDRQLAELDKQIGQVESQLKAIAKSDQRGKQLQLDSLGGIVLDDAQADLTGRWKQSSSVAGFVGDGYQFAQGAAAGVSTARFAAPASPGPYRVGVTFTAHPNRSPRVPILVQDAAAEHQVTVNQQQPPQTQPAVTWLGRFSFTDSASQHITISTEQAAPGAVIIDSVVFVPLDIAAEKTAQADGAEAATDPESKDTQKLADRNSRAERQKQLDAKLKQLKVDREQLRRSAPRQARAMVVSEKSDIADIHVAIRGQTHNHGELVPRQTLTCLASCPQPAMPADQSGRLQLAQWLASPENPLASRVIANRVWHWLMGRGLVQTVDNFGSMGQQPSHPELLDHLASTLVADGGSLKKLVRRIMLSSAYQQSAQAAPETATADPENRWWGCVPRQRLDAESLRDTLLWLAGHLDQQMGGPNIKSGTKIEYNYVFDSARRSVYQPVFRNVLPESRAAFDFADPNTQTGQRTSSTVATQALYLMNSPEVARCAAATARRMRALPLAVQSPFDAQTHDDSPDSQHDAQRVAACYQHLLSRPPTAGELAVATRFLAASDDQQRAWTMLCQALIQSLDFRFIE